MYSAFCPEQETSLGREGLAGGRGGAGEGRGRGGGAPGNFGLLVWQYDVLTVAVKACPGLYVNARNPL